MAYNSTKRDFVNEIKDIMGVNEDALDSVIEWIRKRIEVDDVFEQKELEAWALSNGFVKE